MDPHPLLYLESILVINLVILYSTVLAHLCNSLPDSSLPTSPLPPPFPGFIPAPPLRFPFVLVTPTELSIYLYLSLFSQFLTMNMNSRCCHCSPTPRILLMLSCTPVPKPISTALAYWNPLFLCAWRATSSWKYMSIKVPLIQWMAGAGV